MQITWTNCADEMPPDGDSEIIIGRVDDPAVILTPANEIYYDMDSNKRNEWQWTEYTQEKWEYLNK